MTDVDFRHSDNRSDWADISIVQPVTGVQSKVVVRGPLTGATKSIELYLNFGAFGVGVIAGMQFDRVKPLLSGGDDLLFIGVDKRRREDVQFLEAFERSGGLGIGGEIDAAFGGDFLPSFGDESGLIRDALDGQIDDVFGDAQFQIELALHGLAEPAHIAIANMAAIFAQVDRNSVGTTEFGFDGGPYGIGFVATPGLAEGGDVVDVDAEFDHLGIGL